MYIEAELDKILTERLLQQQLQEFFENLLLQIAYVQEREFLPHPG